VGGVVGGLIAIAAVIGGAIFLIRRKKKAERKSIVQEVSQM
jgi:Ca2+/Na+ antiporter